MDWESDVSNADEDDVCHECGKDGRLFQCEHCVGWYHLKCSKSKTTIIYFAKYW